MQSPKSTHMDTLPGQAVRLTKKLSMCSSGPPDEGTLPADGGRHTHSLELGVAQPCQTETSWLGTPPF